MLLTTSEKAQIRYHLGYLNVATAPAMSAGQVVPIQTLFVVDTAMNNLADEFALSKIRQLLARLEKAECALEDALENAAIKRSGAVEMRDDEVERVEQIYNRWGNRVADLLGVPFYPYSDRYQTRGAQTSRVTRGR